MIHKTAEVKGKIGEGTNVWHQAQVREGAVVGKNCNIGKGAYVDTKVTVGDNVKIQNYACVYQGATIEDDVFIGPGAIITNDRYPRAFLWSEDRIGKTLIKKGASIGANATIVCGVTIGEYSMVGAGSVVKSDVPAYTLAVGNPAELGRKLCKCGKAEHDGECK